MVEEGNLTVGLADPEFLRACFKIEGFLFLDFGYRVPRGENFDANFRRFREAAVVAEGFHTGRRGPGDIGCSDAVGGGDGAFG